MTQDTGCVVPGSQKPIKLLYVVNTINNKSESWDVKDLKEQYDPSKHEIFTDKTSADNYATYLQRIVLINTIVLRVSPETLINANPERLEKLITEAITNATDNRLD